VLWLDRLDAVPAGFSRPLAWVVQPMEEDFASLGARKWDFEDAAGLGPEHGARRVRQLGLLRRLAARVFDCTPDAIGFARDVAGGLAIVEPRPSFVSVAARDRWSAVAFAASPIGIDIEVARPDGPLPADLLHPAERTRIDAARDADRPDMFARIWVAKEAYAKASGRLLDHVLTLETRVRGRDLFIRGAKVWFHRRRGMLAAVVML